MESLKGYPHKITLDDGILKIDDKFVPYNSIVKADSTLIVTEEGSFDQSALVDSNGVSAANILNTVFYPDGKIEGDFA